ncbi:MAG TPA: choice-of-anchor tandem repeat GloVer-containing protein [Parafilimonas sp.]|nr:choice-of-anchor tandem repeat GloVer-containing protein [Parafilimonas sp.]
MISLFTYEKTKNLNQKKQVLSFVLLAALLITSFNSYAQNVLVGLTSNGSIEGKGSAFSISTNGNNFSVIKGFTDWGTAPNGSFYKDDDGNFYGMTSKGGSENAGTIFKMSASGQMTMLKQFFYTKDGAYPDGELVKGPDGYLYGMTVAGGTNTYGTIFKISVTGDFSVIKHFNFSTDGAHPHGHLTLASDGNFYGITYSGGSTGAGTIFKLTPDGNYSVIHTMALATEGGNSYSSLTQGKDGYLYGTAYYGGQHNYGTVFKVKTDGSLTVIKHLNTADGTYPQSDIIEAKDGNFYGTCYGGGQNGYGVIFKLTKNGAYSIVKSFVASTDGGYPYGGLMQDTDESFYGITRTGGSKGGGTLYKLTKAGVFSVVYALDDVTEGNLSSSVPVKGNDGSLYALASMGGTFNFGTIFKVTTGGAFTLINTFNGTVLGATPLSSFIKGSDSAYYCTTSAGGVYGYGSIVKICGGKTTMFYSFNKTADGGYPKGNLLLASDGNFYGMTSAGGNNNAGTIFKITPAGKFSVVKHFNGTTEGGSPVGGLIQAIDGLLYGMTPGGGSNNAGTIFKMNLSGTNYSVIKNFVFANDGGAPNGNLLQANDSNFYGMTSNSGRLFKLTPAGVYSNMHTFNSSTDGYNPFGSLIQGIDGSLYGTCSDGGANSSGTVFRMALSGSFKVLVAFNSSVQGRMPKGTLLQGADGTLYGTTSIGGTYNTGTVFRVSAAGSNYTVLRHMNIATDGGNAYGGLIFAPVNNLIADAKSVTVNEDSSVKITLTGSGGSPLTYSIVNNPAHGKLKVNAGKVTYKPNKNYNGADNFSYTVSTGCIASDAAVVNITVKSAPDAPVLATIGNKTVVKNTQLKFKVKATDPDEGQVLSYSLIGAPSGTKINASTGVFTWTPTVAGNFTFKVRATDNDTPPLYDEEQITVTVTNTLTALTSGDDLKLTQLTSARVNIYPNPAVDVLHVNLSSPVSRLNVSIIDQKGTVISGYNFSNRKTFDVNIAALSQGIYLLQLQGDSIKETLKFMKN